VEKDFNLISNQIKKCTGMGSLVSNQIEFAFEELATTFEATLERTKRVCSAVVGESVAKRDVNFFKKEEQH
jgi:hypothetical protein